MTDKGQSTASEQSEKKPPIVKNQQRRKFLAAGVGVAAAMVAGSQRFSLTELARARSEDEEASALTRWGLLIDTEKCHSGCISCVDACNTEHNLESLGRPEADAQWIRKLELTDKQTGKVDSLPMLCQHCENPPCVDVCPTGASFVRADGIVLVNKHTCIGCRYCVMACPYKARSFIHEDLHNQRSWSPRGKGTVESCNLCVHRIDQDRTPACVEACHSDGQGAMVFGDLNDKQGKLAVSLKSASSRQIREDLALNTAVRYRNI
jgi:molybdopterin-containing oxidoreductase family iron-sulfur binding subunit